MNSGGIAAFRAKILMKCSQTLDSTRSILYVCFKGLANNIGNVRIGDFVYFSYSVMPELCRNNDNRPSERRERAIRAVSEPSAA